MCGCEQGTCPGNCACGCSHTAPVDKWDVVRSAQVGLIIVASAKVTEAQSELGQAMADIRRIQRELEAAMGRRDAWAKERDDRTAKVAGFIADYPHIGEAEAGS